MALDSLTVTAPHHVAYRVAVTPPPQILMPQQQVAIAVHVTLASAAAAIAQPPPPPPAVQVSYVAGGRVHRHSAPLPVALPHFARPHSHLSQHWFFPAWSAAATASAGRAAGMTRLPTPVPSAAALTAQMLRLNFWDGGVRLDPTSALNYAGATTLAGVDVLTRVEVDPRDATNVHITVVVAQPVPGLAEVFRSWIDDSLCYLAVAV